VPNFGTLTKIKPKLRAETFRPILEKAVLDLLDKRWKVELAPFDYLGDAAFLVTLPGTVDHARRVWGEEDENDLGWLVAIQNGGTTLAFPHSPMTELERWAQGCIEEELSERLKAPLHYDAGPITFKPGQRREYRRGKTLREYLLRNFGGKPRDAAHEEFLNRIAQTTPKGFWP